MIPVTLGSARAMAEDEDEENTPWESTWESTSEAWLLLQRGCKELDVREDVGPEMSQAGIPQRILRWLVTKAKKEGRLASRNGEWLDVWAEHWGMTMLQIRQLMDDCKEFFYYTSNKTFWRYVM